MRAHDTKSAIMYGDHLSAITNTTEPSGVLKEKHIALAYHFCQDYFLGNLVDIRRNDTNDNYVDPFTKRLVSMKLHRHINEVTED